MIFLLLFTSRVLFWFNENCVGAVSVNHLVFMAAMIWSVSYVQCVHCWQESQ